MKKILVAVIILFAGNIARSQTVNDTPITAIDVEYVEIVGEEKFLSNKMTVHIDFGQQTSFWNEAKGTVIKDENGKPVVFNSMIDALNFMSKNGYKFVTAYVVTEEDQSEYHYLLKKEKAKVRNVN